MDIARQVVLRDIAHQVLQAVLIRAVQVVQVVLRDIARRVVQVVNRRNDNISRNNT